MPGPSPNRGPFRGPTKTRRRLIQAAVVTTVTSLPVFDWFAPLETPPAYQIEPGLSAAWQQYYSGLSVPTIDTDFIGPLSEPVRVKPVPVREGIFTTDWKWSAPSYLPNWHRPFSEPVRVKARAAYFEPFTTDWKWSAPPLTDLRAFWFSWLSEPVRAKARAPYFEPFTTDWKWSAPSYLPNWHQPFSEPRRFKQAVAYQQPFTFDWKWSPPSFLSNWHQPFSEPRRSRQSVPYQQAFTTDWKPTAVTVTYFPLALSEPVRTRRAVPWQQFFTTDWNTPPTIPITYSFSITEIGDTGVFVFTANDLVIGANVTMTERWVDDLANVTTTEIPQYGANVSITERGTAMANVTITETD